MAERGVDVRDLSLADTHPDLPLAARSGHAVPRHRGDETVLERWHYGSGSALVSHSTNSTHPSPFPPTCAKPSFASAKAGHATCACLRAQGRGGKPSPTRGEGSLSPATRHQPSADSWNSHGRPTLHA